jgi:hypothetical protein
MKHDEKFVLMLVIVARFKAEQICRKRHFKIVSSGESLICSQLNAGQ